MTDKLFKLVEKITPQKWHWVLNHDGYKRYFSNTSWMFGGQMFSLLVSFFIGAWIARYLGPENYGVFSYSVAFVGIFGFIASLGVDSILNRELIKTPEKRDVLLGTAFRMKLIGGIIALSLAILSAFVFLSNPLIKLLVILFSFSFIFQSLNVISNYFNAEVKAKNNVKVTLVTTFVSSFFKVLIIFFGRGVVWFVAILVLDSLLQGIGFITAYKSFGLKLKDWSFDKTLSRKILGNSWPLMLAGAASFIYLKIDQVMIGSMLGDYKVGIYAVAVKLVEVWYFVPAIITTALFPAIINAKKTSKLMYKRRLNNFYILMAVIPVTMAIPVTLLAKPIIQVLFGAGYLEAVSVLRIYIWSSVGLFLGWAGSQYLMSENLVKTIFWVNLFSMLLNLGLNLIFIPKWGIVGSAWATLVSYFIVPLLMLLINKYNYRKVSI